MLDFSTGIFYADESTLAEDHEKSLDTIRQFRRDRVARLDLDLVEPEANLFAPTGTRLVHGLDAAPENIFAAEAPMLVLGPELRAA